MKHSMRLAVLAGLAVLLVLAVPVVRAQAPGAWLNQHLASTAKACSLLGLLLALGLLL